MYIPQISVILPFYFRGVYLTPGNTHSISNNRLAAVRAVVPFLSKGGDTYRTEKTLYKYNGHEQNLAEHHLSVEKCLAYNLIIRNCICVCVLL